MECNQEVVFHSNNWCDLNSNCYSLWLSKFVASELIISVSQWANNLMCLNIFSKSHSVIGISSQTLSEFSFSPLLVIQWVYEAMLAVRHWDTGYTAWGRLKIIGISITKYHHFNQSCYEVYSSDYPYPSTTWLLTCIKNILLSRCDREKAVFLHKEKIIKSANKYEVIVELDGGGVAVMRQVWQG